MQHGQLCFPRGNALGAVWLAWRLVQRLLVVAGVLGQALAQLADLLSPVGPNDKFLQSQHVRPKAVVEEW